MMTTGYATSQRQAKQAALSIDPLAFREFAIQGRTTKAVKCIKGIPPDAEFIRFVWTGESLALIFEHESFDMCHVGTPIPFLELEFEDIAPVDIQQDYYAEPKGGPYEAV